MTRSLKSTGTRYTLKEKLMCLTLYKTCGSAYRFLAKWFNLPTKRTITRLLHNIPVKAGINDFVFENLEKKVKKMTSKEKLCSVIFDEIVILPHIEYDRLNDKIVGIQNQEIVDHALVFMVKGIYNKWKQVIAYTFCKGTTKSPVIKTLLQTVIEKLNASGLNVITTICDQGSTNRAAINSLIQDSRRYYLLHEMAPLRRFVINEKEITPLYDVPHLIKGIRNNLLTKNLIWKDGQNVHTAKWKDIITAYEIDSTTKEIRSLPKITEYHVRPNKIKKMKVSNATQIFSHSMAAAIHNMAAHGDTDVTGLYTMEKTANGTAKILKFFDTLFDTLNTDSRKQIYNKPFKTSVHPKSGHIVFWQNAIRNLKNMHYQEPGTNRKIIPPSLKNFILTLEGFIDVSNRLFSIIPRYNTRMLNQDCLENFFGQIRQHRGRLTHPNSTQFTESYKTLFLKQVSGTHSPKGNCEETVDKSLITVNNFNLNTHKSVDIVQDPFLHVQVQKIIQKPLRTTTSKYLCTYVYNAVLRSITCNLCMNYIFKDARHKLKEIYITQDFLNVFNKYA